MNISEKVEATLRQWVKPDIFVSEENLQPVAAAILAIPEIAEALESRRGRTVTTEVELNWPPLSELGLSPTFPDKEG